jgi:hypothetical protein
MFDRLHANEFWFLCRADANELLLWSIAPLDSIFLWNVWLLIKFVREIISV